MAFRVLGLAAAAGFSFPAGLVFPADAAFAVCAEPVSFRAAFGACLALVFDGVLAGPADFAALAFADLVEDVLAAACFEPAVLDTACLDAACLDAFFRAAEVFAAELALVVARAEIGFRLLAVALEDAAFPAARFFGALSSLDMTGGLCSNLG